MKHVGKHNSKRIVLLYRQVPDENHMCLLLYSDALPQLIHDDVMKVLESALGQQAGDLADALFRSVMADGRNTLESLHREGYIKKVNTNQVIITPNAKSSVRLDELNTILNEMTTGEDAVKRLADLDANQGMTTKKRQPRELGVSPASRTQEAEINSSTLIGDILTDEQISTQRIAQAAKMKMEAKQLLAEADRLEAEAASFTKTLNGTRKTTKAKTTKKQTA